MPTDRWASVEKKLGGRVSSAERRYAEALLGDEVEHPDLAVAEEDWIDGAAAAVRAQRAAELRAGVFIGRALDDPRWGLQIRLNNEYRRRNELSDDSAIRRPWTLATVDGISVDIMQEPMSRKLSISFDSRLSQEALFAVLREAWSDLKDAGLLRRTRTLGDRAIAILEHVCLWMPTQVEAEPGSTRRNYRHTWRQRMDAWNQRFPDWAYDEVRKFERAFSRAEVQFSGERRGLSWFYDVTSESSRAELISRADGGDGSAISRLGAIEADEKRITEYLEGSGILRVNLLSESVRAFVEHSLKCGTLPDGEDGEMLPWGTALLQAARAEAGGRMLGLAVDHVMQLLDLPEEEADVEAR